MAKVKKQVKTVDKWKKKKWFTLIAPKFFQERSLGETCTSSADLLLGRTVSVNLMTLTGNIKKQNTKVQFEISEVQGDKALTQVKKIELLPAFIKRRVRRSKDRIDASFVVATKDNKAIRVKPMLITTSKSSRATQTEIRKMLIDSTLKYAKSKNYEDFVSDAVNYRFQIETKKALSKLFPIASTEIRSFNLLEKEPSFYKVPEVTVEKKRKPSVKPEDKSEESEDNSESAAKVEETVSKAPESEEVKA
jgi:small subunit ribosomal protein S3Ae